MKIQIYSILMKFKPYVEDTKLESFPKFQPFLTILGGKKGAENPLENLKFLLGTTNRKKFDTNKNPNLMVMSETVL